MEVLLWNYLEPLTIRSFAAGRFPDLYALRDYVEDINTANNIGVDKTNSDSGHLMLLAASTYQDARPIILTGANYSDIQGGTILYLPWSDLNVSVRSPIDPSVTVSVPYGVTDDVQLLRTRVAASLNIHEKFFDLVYKHRVLLDDDLIIDVCRATESDTLQAGVGKQSRDSRNEKTEHTLGHDRKNVSLLATNGNHGGVVASTRNTAENNNLKPSSGGAIKNIREKCSHAVEVVLQPGLTVTLNIRTFWQCNYRVRMKLTTRVASVVELVVSLTFKNKATLNSHSRLLPSIMRLEHPDGTLLKNDALLVDCISLQAQATGYCELNLQQVTVKANRSRKVVVKCDSAAEADLCYVNVTSNSWLVVALQVHCITGLPVDCLTLQQNIKDHTSTVNVWSSISVQRSDIDIIAVLRNSAACTADVIIAPARSVKITVSVPHMPAIALHCDLGETMRDLKDRLKVKGVTDADQCSVYHKQVRLLDTSHLAHYDTLADCLAFELRRVDMSVIIIIGHSTKRITVDCGMSIRDFTDYVRQVLRKSKLLYGNQLAEVSLVYCGRLLDERHEAGEVGGTVGDVLTEDSRVFALLFSQRSIRHQMCQLKSDQTTVSLVSLTTRQSSNIKLAPPQPQQKCVEASLNLLAFLQWKYQLSALQCQSTPSADAVDGDADISNYVSSKTLSGSGCDETPADQQIARTTTALSILQLQDTHDDSFVVLTVKQFYHHLLADDPYLIWYWNNTLY